MIDLSSRIVKHLQPGTLQSFRCLELYGRGAAAWVRMASEEPNSTLAAVCGNSVNALGGGTVMAINGKLIDTGRVIVVLLPLYHMKSYAGGPESCDTTGDIIVRIA